MPVSGTGLRPHPSFCASPTLSCLVGCTLHSSAYTCAVGIVRLGFTYSTFRFVQVGDNRTYFSLCEGPSHVCAAFSAAAAMPARTS